MLLHKVKLNIARQNDYTKQNINVLHFLANKPGHELSGIRKKRKKTFCAKGTIHENSRSWTSCKLKQHCRTKPKMTKHSRKSSHSFKVCPVVGKIQSKLFPRATLIQLSGVRMNYFEVCQRLLSHSSKMTHLSRDLRIINSDYIVYYEHRNRFLISCGEDL